MNKQTIALFLIILILSVSSFVYAQSAQDIADQKAGDKLEKGVIQLSTSIIDIPKAIYAESVNRDNPITGAPIGFLKGVGNTVSHIFSGLFNIITCPFPKPTMDAVMFPETVQTPKPARKAVK